MLRLSALISVIFGSMGSLYYTLQAGRNNPSLLLIILFTGWVLSPFISLILPIIFTRKWKGLPYRGIYILSIFIALLSLLAYSASVHLHSLKPAFIFLLVPLFSWILILSILVFNHMHKKKHPLPGDPLV